MLKSNTFTFNFTDNNSELMMCDEVITWLCVSLTKFM